jgi:hypothetical protein
MRQPRIATFGRLQELRRPEKTPQEGSLAVILPGRRVQPLVHHFKRWSEWTIQLLVRHRIGFELEPT